MIEGSKTKINLQIALAGEADANRRYTAFGIRALQEGRPEIAQLFFEAAGAETVHAYSHLLALDAIGSTEENLRTAARGEAGEIEEMYPRMIAEAEAEADHRAAESFRLALEREKYHKQMFERALKDFQRRSQEGKSERAQFRAAPQKLSEPQNIAHPIDDSPSDHLKPEASMSGASSAERRQATERHQVTQAASDLANLTGTHGPLDRAATKRGIKEMEGERKRITRLAGIREVVFGGQDGLISTTTLIAGIAATTSNRVVVLVAGAISALAGALSMGVGSYLASRAQVQLYESELERERREIADKPGEEVAELLAALIGRGMSRRDAVEVARRITVHPRLMMDVLGALELGLTSENLGSPVRDALVTGTAFAAGSLIPLLPFLALDVGPGLMTMTLLALAALFLIGVAKARLSARSLFLSGLEVMALGGAAGIIGYAMGRIVSAIFGISI